MNQVTRRGFVGSFLGAAAATALAAQQGETTAASGRRPARVPAKITDVKCAIIGRNPVIRIVTDQGISGYAQAESGKITVKQNVAFYSRCLWAKTGRTSDA